MESNIKTIVKTPGWNARLWHAIGSLPVKVSKEEDGSFTGEIKGTGVKVTAGSERDAFNNAKHEAQKKFLKGELGNLTVREM